MSRRNPLNRLYGKVYGWFDSKEARTSGTEGLAQFSRRARLALTNLEDRCVPATFTVTTDAPTGVGSIDEAVTLLNASADLSNTINFNFTSDKTIALATVMSIAPTTGTTTIIDGTITGGSVTISGSGAVGLFDVIGVDSGETVTFTNLILQDASAAGNGGAISGANATVNVLNSTLKNNTALNGGAVGLNNASGLGKLSIQNSTLTGNISTFTSTPTTAAGGGAIYLYDNISLLSISNSTISKNSAAQMGGGIMSFGGTITINNSTIDQNTGNQRGGGIANFPLGATNLMTFTNSRITGNVATLSVAGGVYSIASGTSAQVVFDNSTVSGNTALAGGGLYQRVNAKFHVLNSTFSGNVATGGNGGAFSLNGASANFLISNSTFFGNSTAGSGGAMRLTNTGTTALNIRNSTMVGNTAASAAATPSGGGGISHVNATSPLSIVSTIVSGNNSGNANEDISSAGATISVTNSAIGVATGYTPVSNATNLAPGTDLKLAGLANNGGVLQGATGSTAPGQTIALGGTSPAIDVGDNPGGLTNDQRGAGFPRSVIGKLGTLVPTPDMGAYEYIPASTVSGAFSNIETFNRVGGSIDYASSNLGKAAYEISVIYSAPLTNTVDTSTIDPTDIQVTSPVGGYVGNPISVVFSSTDGNKNVTATYTLQANGGTWDAGDNGAYTVSLVGVVNTSVPASIPLGPIGAPFLVDVGQVYSVTSKLDSGAATLREALTNASIDTPTAMDIITFGAPDFGSSDVTIDVASNMTTASSVFVNNSTGFRITLSPNTSGFRVLSVTDGKASGIEAKIGNIDISGAFLAGSPSGGLVIGINDTVTFDSGTISSHKLDGSGAGIFANAGATLNLTNSTVSGNIAASGAGLYFDNGGFLNITNSTVSGNSSFGGTGGGAAYLFGSVAARVMNSTISGNTATTGGAFALRNGSPSALLEFFDSTVAFNVAGTGGGISRENGLGKIAITSSIVANNTAAVSPDISINGNGTANTVTANFSALGTDPGPGILSGGSGNNLAFGSKLFLTPLRNNGGATLTHGLAAGSASENAGSVAVGTSTTSHSISLGGKSFTTQSGLSYSPGLALQVTDSNNPANFLQGTVISYFGTILNVNVTAVGGSGTVSSWNITVANDQAGSSRVVGPAADIGAIEGVLPRPGANTVLPTLSPTSPFDGKAMATFVVRYTAPSGATIASSEFGASDLTATGPGGAVTVGFVSAVDASAGSKTAWDVTYSLAGPGGFWNDADRGRYSVAVVLDEVKASTTVPVAEGTLGTFLAMYSNTFVVDTNTDLIDPIDGLTSLPEAIAAANDISLNPATDTITFFKGTFVGKTDFTTAQVITLTNQLEITDSLNIMGTGSALLSLSTDGDNRHFVVGASTNMLEMSGMTLTNGFAATGAFGGSMFISGQAVNFTDVTFTANTAGGGAAIASPSSTKLTFTSSSVTGNTSNGDLESSAPIAFTSTVDSPSITMISSTLSNNTNTGTGRGSGISMSNSGSMTIKNGTIENNSAGGAIGGVFYFSSQTAPNCTLLIEDSTINANSLNGFGGIVATFGALNTTIRRTTISNTFVASSGGVVHYNDSTALGSTLVIENSTMNDNTAAGFGGGVGNINAGTVTVTNSTFSGNISSLGTANGGASVFQLTSTATLFLRNSTLVNNTSNTTVTTAGVGGTISNLGGTVNVASSVFFNNTAANGRHDIGSSNNITANNNAIFEITGWSLGSGTGNIFATDPLFVDSTPAGLVNNGGVTKTYALQGTSPLIDIGSNPAGVIYDQRGTGFLRNSGATSKADIGAFEFQSASPAFLTFVVNNGDVQRSRLTEVDVNFSFPVDAAQFQAAGAVSFTRTGIPTNNLGTVGTVVDLSSGLIIAPASGNVSSLTLTFANILNSGVEFGSLADGRWQMAVTPASFTSPNTPGDIQLRRLFGNVDNDTTVGGTDFGFFPPFGAITNSPFDWDNNSDFGATDFGEFGNRFGFTLL